MEAQTSPQCLQQPFPREALFQAPVREVPGRRFSSQHPSSWLEAAAPRQIWQFRPRKQRISAHRNAPRLGEGNRHPAGRKVQFSPPTAVCCLAHYLQLKSFCSQFLCLVVEGGMRRWQESQTAPPAANSKRRLQTAPTWASIDWQSSPGGILHLLHIKPFL